MYLHTNGVEFLENVLLPWWHFKDQTHNIVPNELFGSLYVEI